MHPITEWFQTPYMTWALDGLDLSQVHFWLCFVGVLLCVYFMQIMNATKLLVPGDGSASYHIRRVGLACLALALCWASIYSTTKGWQPWPPDVLIIAMVDVLLTVNIVVARRTLRAPVRVVRVKA